jgi:hypothetical protein
MQRPGDENVRRWLRLADEGELRRYVQADAGTHTGTANAPSAIHAADAAARPQ